MSGLPLRRPSLLLELDLTQHPVSVDPNDALARLAARGRPQLGPILRTLYEAGSDRHVAGLIIKVGGELAWAAAAELRLGLMAFVASGKPTVAWAEDLGAGTGATAALTLASALGEVWLQPGGAVGPLGVAIETTFVRRALDRLGVEPQLGQRHEFKNAVNVLTEDHYTDAHREAVDQVASSVFEDAVDVIARSRRLPKPLVRELVDAGPMSAQRALETGLVDALGYRDQAYDAIRERIGRPVELLLADRWTPPMRPPALLTRQRRHVAWVGVRGAIASGRSRTTPLGRIAGSETVGAALRAAAASDLVGAVLVRVDSPGGSAVASEAIWREVVRTRESGTPVVVSMGELAASGGYYIACPADVIVALPSTLTGSIGVLGGKLVVAGLLDRAGLSTDRVEHGQHALMNSARRPFTEAQRGLLDEELDRIYSDFVAKVAAGRRLPVEQVEQIARGRVWTGAAALRLGLVDELGGMREAFTIAARRGGLPESARLRPALHVPALRRFGRPRNTDDPRASAALGLSSLSSALSDPASGTTGGRLVARTDLRLRR